MADRRVSVEQQSSDWLSSEHLQQYSEATAARYNIKKNNSPAVAELPKKPL
jgi:hypothetical protein